VRRFFRAHGTAYIAMDFVKGRSLGDTLNEDYRTGGYPSEALRRLLVSVLDGLGALHDAGIIHRDVKPGNIVIEPNGNPVLVDFGAARNFGPAAAQGMTVIITPGYAPIEQYSDEREQGPFTDIYALGALAYRAITGEPPDAPYKRLGRNSSVPASVAGAGKYPVAVLSAVDWALAVQPHERPQTAAALLGRLRDAPDEVPVAPDEPTRLLGEATQVIDTSRWRGRKGNDSGAVTEPPPVREEYEASGSKGRGRAAKTPNRTEATATGRSRQLVPLIAASVAVLALIGLAAVYFMTPQGPATATSAEDQTAVAKLKAAEAAREEAARQAAARAEAERQAAAAAKLKAEAEAADAARQDAERQAAAKAEADRQAAAKAEADRQAAAKAEADRQAAAKAEADRQASLAAKLKADQDAAEAVRQNAAREAAAKQEAERRAAAAAAAKKATVDQVGKANTTPRVADTRCTNILQTSQLMGALSDEDKIYLRDHCH
jgi:non-specific serine/threonine protein kinase